MSGAKTGLRVLIVDDEPLARRRLHKLLESQPDIVVAGECGDGLTALALILKEKPDLVFLDIQMPEMNGFDVLTLLPGERVPAIIFVTAYDEFAVQAFSVHALDYLLKPFDDERFRAALDHARRRLLPPGRELGRQHLSALRRQLGSGPCKRLLVPGQDRIRVIAVRDILYISAEDYLVKLHLVDGSLSLRRSLQQLHSELGAERFVRIHRSYLVPVDRVKALHPLFKGEYLVELHGGTRLPMGRHYQRQALEILGR